MTGESLDELPGLGIPQAGCVIVSGGRQPRPVWADVNARGAAGMGHVQTDTRGLHGTVQDILHLGGDWQICGLGDGDGFQGQQDAQLGIAGQVGFSGLAELTGMRFLGAQLGVEALLFGDGLLGGACQGLVFRQGLLLAGIGGVCRSQAGVGFGLGLALPGQVSVLAS